MVIHREGGTRDRKWSRLREGRVKSQARDERERERRRKKSKKSSWIVEWRSQGEEGISLCSSAGTKNDRKKWVRKRLWARERENTQAKCLMWITLGQTSEEDKTANMSHCSLLAFSNRCLVSPSPVIVTRPGWSDLANDVFLFNIYFSVPCCFFKLDQMPVLTFHLGGTFGKN